MKTIRLPALICLFVMGCAVETAIPPDAQLTCQSDQDCPAPWICDTGQELCHDPQTGDGGTPSSPTDEEMATLCGVLYDKAHDCEEEVRAAVGETGYALFETERESFIPFCVSDLLGTLSEADLAGLLDSQAAIPLAPCDLFAGQLASLLADG